MANQRRMRPEDYPSESGHDRVEDGDRVLHIPNRPDAAEPEDGQFFREPEPEVIPGRTVPTAREGLDDLRDYNARMRDESTHQPHDPFDLGGDDPQRLQKEYEWATRSAGRKAGDAAHASVYTAGQLGQGLGRDAREAGERAGERLGDIAAGASARARGALDGAGGRFPPSGGRAPGGGGTPPGGRFRVYYDTPGERDSQLQRIFGDDPVTSLGRIHQEVFGAPDEDTGERSQHLHATSYDGRRISLFNRVASDERYQQSMRDHVGNDYGPSFGSRGRTDLTGQWMANQGGAKDTRPVNSLAQGAATTPLVNSVIGLRGAKGATTASIQFAVDEALQRGAPFTGRTTPTTTGRGKNKVTTPADPPGVAHPTNYSPSTLSFTTPPKGP